MPGNGQYEKARYSHMKKFLSAFLSVVMLLSLSVSAFAADYNDAYVQVDLDGSNIYATSRMATGFTDILATNARELESLEVNDAAISLNAISATAVSADTRYANGYDGTSGTYKIYSEVVNGVRVVRLSWNNLRTSLYVKAESTTHGSFTVVSNSKPANACEISNANATIDADGTFETVFTPVNGSQEIKSLTFVVNGLTRDVAVPAYGSTSVTIANQDIDISVNNGAVTVRAARLSVDMTITAQVYNYGSRHAVIVTPDEGIKSTVDSDYVSDNTRSVIKLVPTSRDVNVGELYIVSENHQYTVAVNEDSARVNNMYFTIDRETDGTVYVTIDRVLADVSIRAYADKNVARIEVSGDRNFVTCDKYGTNLVRMYEPFTAKFYAKRDVVMSSIRVTFDGRSYTADVEDDYIKVGSNNYFRVYRDRDNNVTVSIDRVPGNMKIEAVAKDSIHNLKISTDSKVTCDVGSGKINDGEYLECIFTPKNSDDTIRTIKVTVNGKTYSADPSQTKYITVDGEKWYFSYGNNNSVTLECDAIMADTTIYASVVKNASGSSSSSNSNKTYSVTKTPDAHSNIKMSGSKFDAGDDVEINVNTDTGYILKSVTLTVNGRSATITPKADTKTIKVDGEVYDVEWNSNADMTIKLTNIYANAVVKCLSEKGTVADYTGSSSSDNSGSVNVSDNNGNDVNITITTTPTLPDNAPGTNVGTNIGVGAYHPAYMYGFNDNTFRPDQAMTRAQAIAILARLYSGVSEEAFKAYAGTPGFQDVNPNSTFAGYIGYAKQSGYLAGIVGSGLNLYPNKAITRAEFCYLLCSFMNCNLVGVSTTQVFNDVASNHWAIVYVNYCAERGWANGYADGMFKPDSSLTRAQICAIVNRINNRAAGTTTVGFNLRNFNDVSTSYWAYNDIMEATHNHTVASIADGVETWSK